MSVSISPTSGGTSPSSNQSGRRRKGGSKRSGKSKRSAGRKLPKGMKPATVEATAAHKFKDKYGKIHSMLNAYNSMSYGPKGGNRFGTQTGAMDAA